MKFTEIFTIVWITGLIIYIFYFILKIIFYYSSSTNKISKLIRKFLSKSMVYDTRSKLYKEMNIEDIVYIKNYYLVEEGLNKFIEKCYIEEGYDSLLQVLTKIKHSLPLYTKEVYNNKKFLTSDELKFIRKYTNLN